LSSQLEVHVKCFTAYSNNGELDDHHWRQQVT